MNSAMKAKRNTHRSLRQGAKIGRPLLVLSLLTAGLLSACSDEIEVEAAADGARWYNASQLAAGSEVFAANCARCHGSEAQGLVDDWKQKLDDGSFPPPPLNGSAHAWHHPQSVLLQVIDNGGADFGGNMPGFASVLQPEEKLLAIAFFQSFWSDEIYQQWVKMGGSN